MNLSFDQAYLIHRLLSRIEAPSPTLLKEIESIKYKLLTTHPDLIFGPKDYKYKITGTPYVTKEEICGKAPK